MFILAFIFMLTPQSQGGEKKRNTFIAGSYLNFTGERENSLSGVQGYGLTVISTPHKDHFRLIYGATLSLVDGRGYIDGTRYGITGYSADAIIGLSIYPITQKVAVRPFLELAGLGGFKYLEIASPPTGFENRSSGLSYGYRLSIGLETSLTQSWGGRLSVDYSKNAASILNISDYGFDNFGITLGFYF